MSRPSTPRHGWHHPLVPAPAGWVRRAACAGRDADALFVDGADQLAATAVCQPCEVRLECLAEALDAHIEFGVWGGLTAGQRRALRAKHPGVTSWRERLHDQARAQ